MRVDTLADARAALAIREGIAPETIEHHIGYWARNCESRFLHAQVVGDWATQKGVDATGWNALFSNSTGSENTATGAGALNSNTTGVQNTATGLNALCQQHDRPL